MDELHILNGWIVWYEDATKTKKPKKETPHDN